MASLTKKIVNGKPYYYLRECQRVGGKPKIVWTLYLGSVERMVERLMCPDPKEIDICEFGASAACFDVAAALDVAAIIDRHVPKRSSDSLSVGSYLLLAALNRCVAPCSKARLGAWYASSFVRRLIPASPSQLTSQRFWDNMNRVDEAQLRAIERELSHNAVSRFGLDLRCLLFDATNFFTFVDSFNPAPKLPQRGHSKEGRDNLRIVGLALLVTSDGDVPLFHHTYPGNQPDSVTFQSVADELALRCRDLAGGVSDITLVFDKGNNSAENLASAGRGPFHFVGSLVPTQHPELLAVPRRKMRRLDPETLPAVWSYRTRKKVFGCERTILCTFNQPLFDAQQKTLRREIAKRNEKLEALRLSLVRQRAHPTPNQPTLASTRKNVESILKGRHMKTLFSAEVIVATDGLPALRWEFHQRAWETLRQTLLGKTILFTDRDDWTDEQIVLAYRAQYHVEGAFRCMKDPRFLTFRPMFHWTDQKLRVHAFYCVLALMIVSLLRRKLAHAGICLSPVDMLRRLTDIRQIALVYPAPPAAKTPFVRSKLSRTDDVQNKIIDALGLIRHLDAQAV